MRRAARTDANQQAIMDALRRIGASVRDTSMIGQGFPDLAVGFRSETILLEVKDGTKPPSARELTPDEKEFHRTWRGRSHVVCSAEEAIKAITQR